MFYKRNWNTFGLSVLITGLGLAILGVILFKPDDLIYCLVAIIIGVILSILGARIIIWDWKDSKAETQGKVDKSLNYVFTLSTPRGMEVVTDYVQIENALNELEKTKQGMVEVKIEPAMARICSVDCSYKKGYFYTYYLQEREGGKGYWFSVCESTFEAKGSLKRLFVKHKKPDFEYLNRMDTGEGR